MSVVGFIGLGNVGAKLAGSLVRNGHEVWLNDLQKRNAEDLLAKGAHWADKIADLCEKCETIITCLPSPAISRDVVEKHLLPNWKDGQLWMEMSTTDYREVIELGKKIIEKGGKALECPVSGGCHRAATGNISIFAGGIRETFELAMPILTNLGRRILHTGDMGTASQLKVMTNYLATANLITVCEALVTCKAVGLDMNTTYEAIKISSGTSFVHETEGQVILNGSRDINFTMDLVLKDIGLFQSMAENNNVPLEISPMLVNIFQDAIEQFGGREFSPNIIKRLEQSTNLEVLGRGFPADISDDEPEEAGYEVKVG